MLLLFDTRYNRKNSAKYLGVTDCGDDFLISIDQNIRIKNHLIFICSGLWYSAL